MTERLHDVFDIDDADVRVITEAYGLGTSTDCARCGAGLVNSNYKVVTENGTYLLRIYPEDRTAPEVAFELAVLSYLDQAEFFGPTPVVAVSGETVGTLRGRLFSVLTYVEGSTVGQDELTADLADQVGGKYAHFRKAVHGFRPAGERENADHHAVSELLRPLLADVAEVAPHEAALISDAWAHVEDRFRDVPGDRLEVVHGDLFYENIIVDDGRLITFIDYDDAYLGLPLLDLALVVMEFSTHSDNHIDGDLAATLLRAYAREGGDVGIAPEIFHDALIFLCCKFMAYTLPLTLERGEGIAENEYFIRLRHLRNETVRTNLLKQLSGVLTLET
ncbi:phosphotransferase [Streptomyces anulatus]|uniref:phosphotransferase n=1 Tax=Streptomyces anulatus TaxID=1892 RepID=UPI003409CCC3|nr:phosphotransferase [Streptomyces anulatus]WSU32608.1 phosphotransferase [Streptomyces anulatus]WSU88541.1 phosphotransferase [Streptomyces anulatus]